MFNDIISGLTRTEEVFNQQVRDTFGRSIDDNVFRPALEELQRLENTHNEAEFRVREIQALTLELRMIL